MSRLPTLIDNRHDWSCVCPCIAFALLSKPSKEIRWVRSSCIYIRSCYRYRRFCSLILQTRNNLIHCVFSAVRYCLPSCFSITTPPIRLQSYGLLRVVGYSFAIIITFITSMPSLIIVMMNCCHAQSSPSPPIVSHWMCCFLLLRARSKRYVFMISAYYRRFCSLVHWILFVYSFSFMTTTMSPHLCLRGLISPSSCLAFLPSSIIAMIGLAFAHASHLSYYYESLPWSNDC